MSKTRKETVMEQFEERREAEIKRQFNLEWPKVEEIVSYLEVEAERQFIECGKIHEELKKVYVPEKRINDAVARLMAEDVREMGYRANILLDNSIEIYWQ